MRLGFRRTRRVPFVPQMEAAECGAASLAMVLAFHGHHAPLHEVRVACETSRDGGNALALVQAARRYGLLAEGVRAEPDALRSLDMPAIVHWSFRHFVVLERVTPHSAIIVDPSSGRRTIAWDTLHREFTGVVILARPGASFVKRRRTRSSLWRLIAVAGPMRSDAAQAITASLLLLGVGLMVPLASRVLIDSVVVPKHASWLIPLALGLLSITAVRSLVTLVRAWSLQRIQMTMDRLLLTSIVQHLLYLPLAFFLQRRTGDIAQRVQSVTVVRSLATTRALATALDALSFLAYGTLMIMLDLWLAIAVLALAVIRVAVLLRYRQAKRQLALSEGAASGRETSALVEMFSSTESTKACASEERVFLHWADRATERINSALRRQTLELAGLRAGEFLQLCGVAAVLWIAAEQLRTSQITVGTLTAVLALQAIMHANLESLLLTSDQVQHAAVQLTRVDDVLLSEPEPSGDVRLQGFLGGISLQSVSFRYSPSAPLVLRDVTMSVRPGERVFIVGPSGSGKSTLAKLLLCLYHPTSGILEFDGVDGRRLDAASLRQRLGAVLQDDWLFDATIRGNICLGLDQPAFSTDELARAARLSGLEAVIDALPQGFDTDVGQNAARLSGGQRQRLALARALLRRPALLVLDEGMSAVDPTTEEQVSLNLRGLPCTQIFITHRLSCAEHSDRVYVLSAGAVVQSGTYLELAEQEGLFRTLASARPRPLVSPA